MKLKYSLGLIGAALLGAGSVVATGMVNLVFDSHRPIGGGFYQEGLGVVNNANPLLTTTITPEGTVSFNPNGQVTTSVSQVGGTVAHGLVVAYNGTGGGGLSGRGDTVHVDGSGFVHVKDDASGNNVKYKGKIGTPSNPTEVAGYIEVEINGVVYDIPVVQ